VTSSWRHLDFGRWQVLVRARLRRLACPQHGVRVEAIPFARARSGFTRDFEDLVAYLATKTDKTTITRLSRVDWDTVGGICERVVADGLDPTRLDGLVNIGVDEVSWRRHHRYLTLVAAIPVRKSCGAHPVRTLPPRTRSSPNSATSVLTRSRR
jgi:transposase